MPPDGATLLEIGPIVAPPSLDADGTPVPGDVLDPRYHVNAAWHGVEPSAAFRQWPHPDAGHQWRAANRPGQVDDRWRPYFAAGGTNGCEALSQVAYFPRRLAESVMQPLTAP